MAKYAIWVVENNLDLIEVLSGGQMRPEVEDGDNIFVFEAIPPSTTQNQEVMTEKEFRAKYGKEVLGVTIV